MTSGRKAISICWRTLRICGLDHVNNEGKIRVRQENERRRICSRIMEITEPNVNLIRRRSGGELRDNKSFMHTKYRHQTEDKKETLTGLGSLICAYITADPTKVLFKKLRLKQKKKYG